MHNQFMQAALDQAYLGRGLCAPNPSVGAVLVSGNRIVSTGYHRGAGLPHAEILAINGLAIYPDDLSLYVTLEPCNHWGKTPPCVAAILKAPIRRVVYGYKDPNPLVSANETPKQLASQGVEVLYQPLPQIDAFYQSYAYWTKTKRPFVTAKLAQSFDGKIALAGGQPLHFSNADCDAVTHQHRLWTDCILTTAKTVRQDDPLLTARCAGVSRPKTIAILDRTLSLGQGWRLFEQADRCLIYHDKQVQSPPDTANLLYRPVSVVDSRLDLDAVLADLGQAGFHDLWVEAGGTLFSNLHQQRLVQRTFIYLVPKVLGEQAVVGYHGSDFLTEPVSTTWQVAADNVIAQLDWVSSEG